MFASCALLFRFVLFAAWLLFFVLCALSLSLSLNLQNTQLTISGYSPLEVATGRRPPDLFDVEKANPEQLSATPFINISITKTCFKSTSGSKAVSRFET